MDRLKVLLINPNFRVRGLDGIILSPPLGLFSITACVKDICDTKILDLKAFPMNKKALSRFIKEYSPDVIGISMTMTPSVPSALEIASLGKKCGIFVVAGGHHATFEADNLLKSGRIDLVVRGEGEITFQEVAKRIAKGNKIFSDILGISYIENEIVFHNADRPPITPLDTLPKISGDIINVRTDHLYPYHLFGNKIGVLETSRGCAFHCKFCSVQSFYRRIWRKYGEDRIIKEIKTLKDGGIKHISFTDDNFTLEPERVKNICGMIMENKLNDLSFFCQARVDAIADNPEMVKKMAEAGFALVFLGIESASAKNLSDIKKNLSPAKITEAIKILHINKIAIWGGFIIGNMNETFDDIKSTVDFALKSGVDMAQFTVMTPLPGTEFFKEVENEGRLLTYDWRKFDFLNCVFQPYFLKPNDVERWVSRAYRKFYCAWKNIRFIMSTKNSILKNIRKLPVAYLKIVRMLLGLKP